MQITIFGKKRKSNEGREFMTYFTELLNRQTGELEKISVKFREECGAPRELPANILVEKSACNIAKRKYTDSEGTECYTKDLWVTDWTLGDPYEDHSCDDYFE